MKILRRIILLIGLLVIISGSSLTTQAAQISNEQIPGPPPKVDIPLDLPMHSTLYYVDQFQEKNLLSTVQLIRKYQDQGLMINDAGQIQVEVVGMPGRRHVPSHLITDVGGRVTNVWRHRLEAWVPTTQLIELAESLPKYYSLLAVRLVEEDDVTGEGPAVTNSSDYRDNGADCSGLTIAVIDSSYTNLTAATNNGDAPTPANRTLINLTENTFESGTEHGTAATETVFDHCPGATYRLYKVDTITDLGTAVDDAQLFGVDIISHSRSEYNIGWADDSGDACAAATDAAESGILFFTSVGNRAKQHWQGSYLSTDADNWHEWSAGDEALQISMPAGRSGTFSLQWDTSGGPYNYDLYLYDATLTTVLTESVSTAPNMFEEMSWFNSSESAVTVYLAVSRVSGGATQLEVFNRGSGDWQEHIVAAGSNTSPSNCTHPNIISVGAVDHSDFSSAEGTTGILQDYSSQGPSNSGMTLPDISGPTNTAVFSYSPHNTYGGTSCATPNVAGVAGTLWSSAPTLNASSVRHLLFEMADIYRDWGTAGKDNLYGEGGSYLYDWHANTVWVDRGGVQEASGWVYNFSGLTTYPYYYVSHAQNNAVAGGRVVFLGGLYPESITLTKQLLYETIGSSAQLED